MQPQQDPQPGNPLNEDVIRTQEMSLEELELALKIANRAVQRTSALEPLLIPSELKHLSPLDWEIVGNLLMTLECEKAWSPLH
jgi:hypothetical protein